MPLEDFPNNPDITSEINQNVINQTTPQGFVEDPNAAAMNQGLDVDPYSQQLIDNLETQYAPAAIGPQGAGLYPGIGHNINVGSVSGSQIGAGNIYVPGGNIRAVDPILARRKAIDDAAKARAATIKPFEYADPMKLKDARFQETFNKSYNQAATDMIEKAKAKYGKDFSVVLKDQGTREGREFAQTLSNYEYLGRNQDQITDKMAEIEANLETGDIEYTKETLKELNDFQNLLGNFEKGDVFKSKDLQQAYEKLEGAIGVENYIQRPGFLTNIMGKVTQSPYDVDKGEFYKSGTIQATKYKESLKQVAKSLAEGPLARAVEIGTTTEDKIFETLDSRFKDEYKKTGTLQQKSAATRAGQTEEVIAGSDLDNKYSKEAPGSGEMFTYNPDGTRKVDANGNPVTFDIKPLMDAQMTIKDKKRTITERLPNGKTQETEFSGVPLENVQVLTPDGVITIPGKSYAEMSEASKLADGSIVQKARIAIPTKQNVLNAEGENVLNAEGKNVTMDTYSFQDMPIVLQHSNGKGTGARTEIKSKLKSDDSRKSYDNAMDRLESWEGGKSTPEPKTENTAAREKLKANNAQSTGKSR